MWPLSVYGLCHRALQEAQDIFGIDFDFDEFEQYDEDEEEEDVDDDVNIFHFIIQSVCLSVSLSVCLWVGRFFKLAWSPEHITRPDSTGIGHCGHSAGQLSWVGRWDHSKT